MLFKTIKTKRVKLHVKKYFSLWLWVITRYFSCLTTSIICTLSAPKPLRCLWLSQIKQTNHLLTHPIPPMTTDRLQQSLATCRWRSWRSPPAKTLEVLDTTNRTHEIYPYPSYPPSQPLLFWQHTDRWGLRKTSGTTYVLR